MSKYEALFEDEQNIFGGSPKSKFWDIVNQASDDLVKEEIDKIIERFAILETMLIKEHGEDKLNQMVSEYGFNNSMEVEHTKKSLYVEFTGEIVTKLDS